MPGVFIAPYATATKQSNLEHRLQISTATITKSMQLNQRVTHFLYNPMTATTRFFCLISVVKWSPNTENKQLQSCVLLLPREKQLPILQKKNAGNYII